MIARLATPADDALLTSIVMHPGVHAGSGGGDFNPSDYTAHPKSFAVIVDGGCFTARALELPALSSFPNQGVSNMTAAKNTSGQGREVEKTANPGSANENGKASATVAGGDPVNSPVKGNPGESDPAAGGYDYGLAAANPGAAPITPTATPTPVQVNVTQQSTAVVPGSKDDKTEYAELVRARAKGEYNGLREKGDIFDNDRNLPTYPEDPNGWFEDADTPAEDEQPTRRRRTR